MKNKEYVNTLRKKLEAKGLSIDDLPQPVTEIDVPEAGIMKKPIATSQMLMINQPVHKKNEAVISTKDNPKNDKTKWYDEEIRNAASTYLKYGFKIVPLHPMGKAKKGKEPFYIDWTNQYFGIPDIQKSGGIGLKTGIMLPDSYYFHVIDIDCKDNSKHWLDEIVAKLSLIPEEIIYQITASKGYHLFIKTSEPLCGRRKEVGDGQIELKGCNQQVVVSPTRAFGKDLRVRSYQLEGNIQKIPFIKAEFLKEYFKYSGTGKVDRVNYSESYPIKWNLKENKNRLHNIKKTKNLLKNSDLETILTNFGINFNDYDEYVQVACPFHPPDNHPSFVIYKGSGVSIDNHDNNMMTLYDYLNAWDSSWKDIWFEKYGKKIEDVKETKRHSLANMFELPAEEFLFKEYISEQNELIQQIVTDSINYEIISKTGTGKTQAIIQMALKTGTKMIYLLPYQSTVIQKANYYNVPWVDEDIKSEDISIMSAHAFVFIGTYDSLPKFFKTQLNMKDYVLCIDEYHNFSTQIDFRSKAIVNVNECLDCFKKTIKMTGTPEGVFNPVIKGRRLQYVQETKESNVIEYNIVTGSKDPFDEIINHINQQNYQGKVVILYNDKQEIEKFQEYYLKQGLEENQITILHSQKKNHPDYRFVTIKEQFNPEAKIILTTTVISDGVNINNKDIVAVYMANISDMLVVRQFIARFRKATIKCYDFIPGKKQGLCFLENFETQVQNIIKDELLNITNLNGNLTQRDTDKRSSRAFLKIGKYKNNIIYYSERLGRFQISENYIRFLVLNEYYYVFRQYPENRQEYLETFEYFKVNLLSLDNQKEKNINEICITLSAKNKEYELLTLELLRNRRNELLYVYNLKYKKGNRDILKTGYSIPEDFDENEFHKQYKMLYDNSYVVKILDRYCMAIKNGISDNFAIKICLLNTRPFNGFIDSINIILNFGLIKQYPELLQTHEIGNELENVEIIHTILENVSISQTIDTSLLAEQVEKVFKPTGSMKPITDRLVSSIFLDLFVVKRISLKKTVEIGRQKTEKMLYKVLGYKNIGNVVSEIRKKYPDLDLECDVYELTRQLEQFAVKKAGYFRVRSA